MDWIGVAWAGVKGGAFGGATVLAVYLIRLLYWDGPIPPAVQRLRWVIGVVVGVAALVGMDLLGLATAVQRTVAAAVVWGVASVLKEQTATDVVRTMGDVPSPGAPTTQDRR